MAGQVGLVRRLRIPGAAAQGEQSLAARFHRADASYHEISNTSSAYGLYQPTGCRSKPHPRKSARPFKGIICDDISEFESYMPSQAVASLWVMCRAWGNVRHPKVSARRSSASNQSGSRVPPVSTTNTAAVVSITLQKPSSPPIHNLRRRFGDRGRDAHY